MLDAPAGASSEAGQAPDLFDAARARGDALPGGALISALSIASMRGVVVNIVVPQRTDFTFLKWAMNGSLWQMLSRGCRVWLVPGPFDHSKLLLVDGI